MIQSVEGIQSMTCCGVQKSPEDVSGPRNPDGTPMVWGTTSIVGSLAEGVLHGLQQIVPVAAMFAFL